MRYPTTRDIARIDRSRGHDCSITTTAARRAFPTIERSLAGLSSGCALKSPFNLLQGVSRSHAASSHAADLPSCWGRCMCAQRAPWESAICDVTVVAREALCTIEQNKSPYYIALLFAEAGPRLRIIGDRTWVILSIHVNGPCESCSYNLNVVTITITLVLLSFYRRWWIRMRELPIKGYKTSAIILEKLRGIDQGICRSA